MRYGNWIQTYTGKLMYPLDPRPEEIDIVDIAHALSNVCRFNGHCNAFYSVAQHSVFVSDHVKPENALHGLLHDASEAYISDIVKPVKISCEFAAYRGVEKILQRAILEKFGLPKEQPKDIDNVDLRSLVTEARDLGLLSPAWKDYTVEPFAENIVPVHRGYAEEMFLKRFYAITKTETSWT